LAEGIPYEVRRSHEITEHGLYLGPRSGPPKIKRGQIDPFGTSSVKCVELNYIVEYSEILKPIATDLD